MAWVRSLPGGAWLFVAAWCVHTADHARRGLSASPEGVFWAGTFVALLACVGVTLILSGHPAAPAAAVAIFPAVGFGVLASHLPPDWGPLSDPIVFDSNSDAWSVLAVSVEVVAAFWLGWLALRVSRRHAFSPQIPGTAWS